jgi:alpha-tubulin suppressor-like RCC1 family protein
MIRSLDWATQSVFVLATWGCSSSAPVIVNERPPASSGFVRRVAQLALGDYHSCALIESGHVACWGDNNQGQLGSEGLEASAKPIMVEGLTNVLELRSAGATVCARRRDHVYCWGDNAYGQADPRPDPALASEPPPRGAYCSINEPVNFAPNNIRRRPTQLALTSDVTRLSVAHSHACALHADGRVSCWGDASAAQLGPGLPKAAFQSSMVRGIPPMAEIASAGDYSCGRTVRGEVWCWGGANEQGQLGTLEPGPDPRLVPSVLDAVGLELTVSRACARVSVSSRVCWGSSGKCADTDTRLAPSAASEELGHARTIVNAYGGCFWCVLESDRELECGELPKKEGWLTLSGVSDVVTGNDHACAILDDGSVRCWGSNIRGELGRLTEAERDRSPKPVVW